MASGTRDPLDGLGKYRPVQLLGRGGMGEVHLCDHGLLGHRVVVKILHEEIADRPLLVDRMRLEAQVLAVLRHPNLVRVTDFGTTPSGRPYFVMDHLPGRSLAEELRKRDRWIPVPEAVGLALQALAGLEHAHARGLVHRDIKPDNLFLCDDERPEEPRVLKILDFGVAKRLDDGTASLAPLEVSTAEGMVVGTPRYFAPEQARGHAIDARADLYSLALCLYTAIAGRGPFDDCRTFLEVARAHVGRIPDAPSEHADQPISRELDAFVLRCLAKRPEDRPRDAAAATRELRRIASSLDGERLPNPPAAC